MHCLCWIPRLAVQFRRLTRGSTGLASFRALVSRNVRTMLRVVSLARRMVIRRAVGSLTNVVDARVTEGERLS